VKKQIINADWINQLPEQLPKLAEKARQRIKELATKREETLKKLKEFFVDDYENI